METNKKTSDYSSRGSIDLNGNLDNMFKVGDGFKITYKKSGKTQMVGTVIKVEDSRQEKTGWKSGGKKIWVKIAWGNVHSYRWDTFHRPDGEWNTQSIKGMTIVLEENRNLEHDLYEAKDEDGNPRVYTRGLNETEGWNFSRYYVDRNANGTVASVIGRFMKNISGKIWINRDGNKWGSENWENYIQTKDHPEYETYKACVREDARDEFSEMDEMEKELLAISLGVKKDKDLEN